MKSITNRFTALDFETAQGGNKDFPDGRFSICQIGLVVFENGEIIERVNQLVKPIGNIYWSNFTQIHGIDKKMTADKPTFDQVWPQIKHLIEGQVVVAHNGFGFDFPILKGTLNLYTLPPVHFSGIDTFKIYRAGLRKCCDLYKIALNHHDALSDAEACGILYQMHLNKNNKMQPI